MICGANFILTFAPVTNALALALYLDYGINIGRSSLNGRVVVAP